MASIASMRRAIAAQLKVVVPGLRTCEPHQGRIDAAELKRVWQATPAVLIACLGANKVQVSPGTVRATLRWVAFIVCQAPTGESRDDAALVIADVLLRMIPEERWGSDEVGRAEQLRAENLYSGTVDRMGVSLWSVTWVQSVELAPMFDATLLSDFNHLHAELDVDRDGTIDPADPVAVLEVPIP